MTFLSLQNRAEPWLYGAIAALVILTFAADLFLVPLGTAVWIVYLLPTALAFFVWRPYVPPATAALASALIAVCYLAKSGIYAELSQINRSIGIITELIIGAAGYLFVRGRLALRKQEWLQAGHVGLSEVMSGEQNLSQLGDNILRFLANYLGAHVAVLFIQEGGVFRRHAAYGAPAAAPIPDQVAAGEGLIGQAIKDRRGFLLHDVPEGYLYVGSALGRSRPRHLLIAPSRANGEINAVVEMGFVGEAPAHGTELLDRVSESIAVAIRSVKYRVRLQDLLEETQRQAEELQAQSEELRSTNEELEEQSRSLQESQSRLELQQSELEQTNAQLEEQTQLLEAQRDDLSRAQAALQAKARELQQASQYKSEFVANMSHELRTPLNSLLIMARLLVENRAGNLTADQVKYAETIEESGNDLLTLINDILDISKIEAGKLDLRLTHVRLGHVADRLKAAFEAAAAQKGLALRTELGVDADFAIETDSQRLEQVIRNFLSNAVKFTERGEVVLAVHRAAGGRIAFTVRDTGIGIAAEHQPAIFEAFRQADGSINRKYGGTGLGLSISRELARLLGGEIQVDSAPGKGSAFTLVVPEIYDAAAVKPRSDRDPSPLLLAPRPYAAGSTGRGNGHVAPASRRVPQVEDDRERLTGDSRIILVVEDDPAFARILCDLAHELGFQCLIADTADEGVVVARQHLPHAVILDMGLPDHTGLSVLDRLKRDVRTRHIPVHVVSVADYMQTALEFGAAGYMLKPVKRDELVVALERLETRLAQRLRRILIVEDDPRQLETLGLLLASRDVETVGAPSAAECLARLKGETFDCMVLDLSLPDASGFEVLEQLSGDDAFAFPPVIVYTARDLSADEELRLRKYSKSIIIKGAKSPERLLDEVTLFLHQVVSELPEQQQKMLAQSLNRDAALEGRRILVVEDDIRNVFALTSIFEPHGAKVHIARNGREALAVLERASQGDAPPIDLVLMDVMMPEMDGLTATREIRSRPHWKGLPVIALTAKAMATDQEQCLAAGANDYLAKPLDVEKLLSLVRVWMPR